MLTTWIGNALENLCIGICDNAFMQKNKNKNKKRTGQLQKGLVMLKVFAIFVLILVSSMRLSAKPLISSYVSQVQKKK